MIVVADTSPLNYLILIDEIEILPVLFGRVIAPYAVLEELLDPLSPPKVRGWAEQFPAWFGIRSVKSANDPVMHGLGAGEREAIQVALNDGIGRVLIDEIKGRTVARGLALQVEGTLGIWSAQPIWALQTSGEHFLSWSVQIFECLLRSALAFLIETLEQV